MAREEGCAHGKNQSCGGVDLYRSRWGQNPRAGARMEGTELMQAEGASGSRQSASLRVSAISWPPPPGPLVGPRHPHPKRHPSKGAENARAPWHAAKEGVQEHGDAGPGVHLLRQGCAPTLRAQMRHFIPHSGETDPQGEPQHRWGASPWRPELTARPVAIDPARAPAFRGGDGV